MKRGTEKPKLEIRKSPKEFFYSLIDMPNWVGLLAKVENDKKYNPYLTWLISNQLFRETDYGTMRQSALKDGFDAAKVTKWIKENYQDVLELNYEKPELFRNESEIPVELTFEYLGNYSFLELSFASLPRIYERFRCKFIEASVGTSYFWVKDVVYYIEDGKQKITMYLDGGFSNKYRDFALEKARFEGAINFFNEHLMTDTEIDEILRNRRW